MSNKDPAMIAVLKRWSELNKEGWTQQKLGEAMEYAEKSARKSVSQFLKTNDPQISVLRRFANAVDMDIGDLVRE